MIDILVISDDVVGEKMAGPGIRAWEISKCLAAHFNVTLAIPEFSPSGKENRFFQDIPFDIARYFVQDPSPLYRLAENSRIILFQGYVLSKFPHLKNLSAHLIADIYVPFVLENLFHHKWSVPALKDREYIHLNDLSVYNAQIFSCDHFLCANTRQKDLFIGSLMSLNRINPNTLDQTPNLGDLITVIPFGISTEEKINLDRHSVRSRFEEIGVDDILFLWGGVLTNWFDPITLIHSFKEALKKNTAIKLLFLSTKHANPLLPKFDMVKKAVQVSNDLGLTGTYIFFNEDWVDYDLRDGYFQDADIGLSITPSHFENHFAARTRMLDYLKHNLPIICTEGDSFSEVVKQKDLGRIVTAEDREGLTQTMITLAGDRDLRERIQEKIRAFRHDLMWSRTTEPLVEYCQKVLSGQVQIQRRQTQEDFNQLFLLKKESWPKKLAKKYFLNAFSKLPHRVTTKVRRLLKS